MQTEKQHIDELNLVKSMLEEEVSGMRNQLTEIYEEIGKQKTIIENNEKMFEENSVRINKETESLIKERETSFKQMSDDFEIWQCKLKLKEEESVKFKATAYITGEPSKYVCEKKASGPIFVSSMI